MTARSTVGPWRLFLRSRIGMLGLALIAIFGLAALTYPLLRDSVLVGEIYDPLFGYDFDVIHPSPPGPGHPLGTDTLGRDVLSMLLAASRSTFVLAVTAGLVTALIGLIVAAIGAYHRGWSDGMLRHLSNAFLLVQELGKALDGSQPRFRMQETPSSYRFQVRSDLLSPSSRYGPLTGRTFDEETF